ncbi:septal ring lytic transglycosylase RlpA family protein [Hyphomicrobium sp.]|uniref:septal ring lytic transglycosylase RlpA family protein n=1 Tax=Hyphomicrobium sp. TaxID=82 RepID=UPI002FDCF824
MRFFAFAAFAALSFAVIGAHPASAGNKHCSKASACGKTASHHTSKKTAHKKAAHKRGHANRSHATKGIASYYWQGQKTASGARFNPNAMTAAHRTLPFGTKVRVTNHNNGRSVTVTINDRGPFIKGRVIDLSKAAAGVIGMHGSGVAPVSIAVLGSG